MEMEDLFQYGFGMYMYDKYVKILKGKHYFALIFCKTWYTNVFVLGAYILIHFRQLLIYNSIN